MTDDKFNDISDDDYLNDMYAENPNAQEILAKRQAAAAHARSYIKMRDKNKIELIDDKGNKIQVSSDEYIKSLENKIKELEKISKAQTSQIVFLNNQYLKIQNDIANLTNNIAAFINDSF